MGELKLSQEKDSLKKSQKIRYCGLPTHLQEEKLHLGLSRPKAGAIKFPGMVQIVVLQIPRKLDLNFHSDRGS